MSRLDSTSHLDSNAPAVTAKAWQQIGSYLQQEDVRLVSATKRRSLCADWKDITHQEESLEDAILLGLVGGTGVGKSTFINALAGQEVSRSSDRRPTTDRVVVYRHVNTEVDSDVPSDDFSQPQVMHDNDRLEKVILFDFPDFDSAEESHTQIIRRYLPFLDVLMVVVDDVKYADRRLYELLATLDHDHENIFVMLNKVDRLDHRYGEKTPQVIEELVADLGQKLATNSGIELAQDHFFPIAALSVFQHRERGDRSPWSERFATVERMLETYQQAKHRRAAKARNIESRKQDVASAVFSAALGAENTSILSEAQTLVQNWQGEMDRALQVVPVDVLSEPERRGVRRSYLRRLAPAWGLPFSLFFTLLGEFRRKGGRAVDPTDLGQRVVRHYRSFFENVKNAKARFGSEFIGSKISLGATDDAVSGADPSAVLAGQFARELQLAVHPENVPSPGSRRWLAHGPALVTLALAIWSRLHPILESVLGTGESGVIWSTLVALVGTLSPTFLIGTLLSVLLVYAATAGVIWLREVQKLEANVTSGEQQARKEIKASGQQVIDQLDSSVRALHAEFEQLDSIRRM